MISARRAVDRPMVDVPGGMSISIPIRGRSTLGILDLLTLPGKLEGSSYGKRVWRGCQPANNETDARMVKMWERGVPVPRKRAVGGPRYPRSTGRTARGKAAPNRVQSLSDRQSVVP